MLHYSCPIILLLLLPLLLPPSGDRLTKLGSLTSLTVLAIWKRKMENALYFVCRCNNTNKMFFVFIIKYIIIKKIFKIQYNFEVI